MSHQSLKFPLQLIENSDWQPIAGTQDHGTFYMIYIKFKSVKTEENNFGVEVQKIECDVRLQNFKGSITMGLVGNPTIQVLSPEERAAKVNTFDPDAFIAITVAPFHKNDFIKNVILQTEYKLTAGMVIETKYQLQDPPQTIQDFDNNAKKFFDINDPDNSAYVNPVYFERDGDEYLEIATKTWNTQQPFQSRSGIGGSPWGICFPNFSVILDN
ncbi:hypothetical protein EAX61_11625 [Dokdonia sinensis]|uniref:Uncharacterized protein n=1 Tax=Dokdonia sinensis TaxID=2479847 RepID=A0A3M0G8L1_9FLAO|nr:hypothetical protein [Dokdonia sinensis]RMB57389.1 hypothetical protein EAX61_11625 [Dokdonia sinensis]